MNCGQNNPQLSAHFEQQSQERNRIDPPRNRDANALPGLQQLMPPNVGKHAVDKGVHPNMVQQRLWGTAFAVVTGHKALFFESVRRGLYARSGNSYKSLNPSSSSYSTKSASS